MQRAPFLTVKKDKAITFVPTTCDAAEEKRIISWMTFFAGARMHFSAVALSSGMTTLSFGYSINVRGINRDIFGHADCCLEPEYLDVMASMYHMSSMLNETATMRHDLTERILKVQREAPKGRIIFWQMIGEN